jgi:hypothetical protein
MTKRGKEHVACMGEKGHVHRVVVEKQKQHHLKPRQRWEDNIKIGLLETGWESVDCISASGQRQGCILVNI